MSEVKDTHDCGTCALANWNRTAKGRLHPSGDGRCQWHIPKIVLPKAFRWPFGHQDQRFIGGYINRKDLARFADCPAWQPLIGE